MSNLPPDFGQLAREADKRAQLAQVKLEELSQRQDELRADVLKFAQATSHEIFDSAWHDKQLGSISAALSAAREALNRSAEISKRATTINYVMLAVCIISAVIAVIASYFSYAYAKGTDAALDREQARRTAEQHELPATRAKRK